MAERWLSCKELAAQWGMAPSTVQRWARTGRLRGVRLGNGRYRFRPGDVETFECGNPVREPES